MIIKLNRKKRRVGGTRIRKRFLYLPLIHQKTLYWLENVKLHYTWNGKEWVIIDILERKRLAN